MAEKPLRDWFNPASPRLKSGEINPDQVMPDAAIVMMLEDPLLIRRPLMQVDDRREAGFDQAKVEAWIGLKKTEVPVPDGCIKQHSSVHVRRCKSAMEV